MMGVLRDLRDATGAVVFGGIVVGTGVVVIGALVWGGIEIDNAITSGTAKSTGNSQVKHDTYSGTNQEEASGIFNQLWSQIQGYEVQIRQAKAAGQSPTDLLVLEQTCDAAVQQWNSDAQAITLKPFIPDGKPDNIDQSVCNG